MARCKVAVLASRLPARPRHSSSLVCSQPSIISKQPNVQMKKKFNKAKDGVKGFFRPRSRQSVLATPLRSRHSSQEPAATNDPEISTTPSAVEIANQSVIAPIQASPVFGDSNSVFEELRGAMSGGNTSLFEPLQSALVDLVKVGLSEVSRST